MADVLLLLFDIQFVAAGFLGGLVHAFNNEDRVTPWEVVRSVVVGSVVANFLTKGLLAVGSLASGFISTRALEIVMILPPGVVAFCIGMCGRKLSYALEMTISNLFGKTKNG